MASKDEPSLPTAFTYDYDNDTYSVTPNTWSITAPDVDETKQERLWAIKAAIDPRNDAGQTVDLTSRMGNVYPVTGAPGSEGTGGGLKELDSEPEVTGYEVGDIIALDDGLRELAITDENTPNLYQGTVGRSAITLGNERWRGISNSQSPNGFSRMVGGLLILTMRYLY